MNKQPLGRPREGRCPEENGEKWIQIRDEYLQKVRGKWRSFVRRQSTLVKTLVDSADGDDVVLNKFA